MSLVDTVRREMVHPILGTLHVPLGIGGTTWCGVVIGDEWCRLNHGEESRQRDHMYGWCPRCEPHRRPEGEPE